MREAIAILCFTPSWIFAEGTILVSRTPPIERNGILQDTRGLKKGLRRFLMGHLSSH